MPDEVAVTVVRAGSFEAALTVSGTADTSHAAVLRVLADVIEGLDATVREKYRVRLTVDSEIRVRVEDLPAEPAG